MGQEGKVSKKKCKTESLGPPEDLQSGRGLLICRKPFEKDRRKHIKYQVMQYLAPLGGSTYVNKPH